MIDGMMHEYPDFHLDADKLPQIKEWETGETYTVVMKIRQMTKNEEENGKTSAGFKVVSVKPEKDPAHMDPHQQKKYLTNLKRRDYGGE